MKKISLALACISRSVVMILFLIGVLPNAGANPKIEITWQNIVKLVDDHPQIGASRHETAAAHAAVDAARAAPNPSVEATAAYGRAIDNSESRFEWGLALSIPLSWIARRSPRIDAAHARVDVADAQTEALRRGVLKQLRVLFWTLVYSQERVAALGDLNDQMATLSTTVRRRVEEGEVRPVEATRVEVEAEKIAGELEVARLAMISNRAALAIWLGSDNGERLLAVADLAQLPDPVTMDTARKGAAKHPDLDAARARVNALEANVTVERRARVPSLAVEIFTDHELDRRAYGVGLAFELPLWNWNTGNIQRSQHMLAAQKNKLEFERLELEIRAIEAQSQCQAGVMLATRYSERILPRAEFAARVIERTYQLGEATLLEVIDARRTLLETRGQFLSTLAQTQIDCSRLREIAGEESQ